MGQPVILFPHSYLSEKDMRRIFSSFGPITIFQPWYMAPPPFLLQNDFKDAAKILNPPSQMKPEMGFRGILSEYKTWIKQHRDKSSAAFMKVSQKMGTAENATWEIRGALRGPARMPRHLREDHALKWHLILHLARDIEEDHREADRLLRELKNQDSPIKGLLGEEDVKNPLTDLSQLESDQQTTLYPMEIIIEAWFALFGGYIKGGELLLTFSRPVMDYASEAWDTIVREDRRRVLKHPSGKTMILVVEEVTYE